MRSKPVSVACECCGCNLAAVAVCVQIMKEDDSIWPQPDRVGRQELEIVSGDQHISFTTTKIGSLIDIKSSRCGWVGG